MAAVLIPDEEERAAPTLPTTGDSLPLHLIDEDDEEEPVEEPAEEEPTRGQLRSRRHREVRAKTINVYRITKRDLEAGRVLYPPVHVRRPKTRGDCVDGIRPCPFVGCKHHLYLDVTPSGSVKLNFPDLEPDQMGETCALDIADRAQVHADAVTESPDDGEEVEEDPAPPAATLVDKNRVGPAFGNTLENVARAMNLTRERVRQIETKALRTLGVRARRAGLEAYQGHAHDQDYAEIIPHQLPIVKRDIKPDNVRRLRVFAPDVDAIGSDDRDDFVEYEAANEEPPSSGADPNEPADFTLNEDEESITPQPEEKEPMRICKRPGCNREFRGIRNMDSIAAGQEEWCRACRSGQEPSGEPTHANRGPEPKAKPAAKRPAKHAVSSKKKPAVVREPKTRRTSSALLDIEGDFDFNTPLADLVHAYNLIQVVGLDVVEDLAKRMGGAAR